MKITNYSELVEFPNNDDFFIIVDTSDTSMSASGTNKKVKKSYIVPQDIHTGASPTFAGLQSNGIINIGVDAAGLVLGTNANTDVYLNFNNRGYVGYDNAGNTILQGTSAKGITFAVNSNTFTSGIVAKFDTSGNFMPNTDSTYTLGTSALYWSNTYTDRLYLNSTAYLDGGTAGLVDVAGKLQANGTLSDAWAWEAGGAGLKATWYSPYDKWQAAIRGAVVNSYVGSRTQPTIGMDFTAWNSAAGTLGTLMGTGVTIGAQYANNAITTNAVGSNVDIAFNSDNSGMSITNATGFKVNSLYSSLSVNTATITNLYGFYMGALSDAKVTVTNKYGVFIADTAAKNYFGGEIEVGTSAAGVILKSPDGTRYRVTIANGGALTTAAA